MKASVGLAVLTLALFGCGGDSGASGPSDESLAQGSWSGTLSGGAIEGDLEWGLEDSGGEISGNGSLSTLVRTAPLTIAGTFTPPSLTLTIQSEGFEDFTFSGTVSEESMKGRLNGSGFNNRTVTLDRQ